MIQTVREKFTCRSCERITRPRAPFHPIARGRAGPALLAMVLNGKFGQHLPLNRQSESFAREGIDLDVDPEAWLADVLRRINDHPASKLDELLPWNWRKPHRAEAA